MVTSVLLLYSQHFSHQMRGVLPTWDHSSTSWMSYDSSTSWMSYHSVRFWHYLPGLSGRSHRLRAQSWERPVASPQITYTSDWSAVNQRFLECPQILSFARMGHRTQKVRFITIADLLQSVFQKIQMNSQMKEACRAMGERGGPELAWALQDCHRPSTALCSPKLKLPKPFALRVFKELSLQCLSPSCQWVGLKGLTLISWSI